MCSWSGHQTPIESFQHRALDVWNLDSNGVDSGPAGDGASPFLLAPFAAGAREIQRRQELLRKRNQRLKIGFDQTDLPPEQQLSYIRCECTSALQIIGCSSYCDCMCSLLDWKFLCGLIGSCVHVSQQ